LPPFDSFQTRNNKERKKERKKRCRRKGMACFVPFNNRNLETSFFIFRPIVALVDELVETLKHFSACTESLGCVQSSIFKSIHGNMVRNYVVLLDQLKYISI
jgi:hypothetical protein